MKFIALAIISVVKAQDAPTAKAVGTGCKVGGTDFCGPTDTMCCGIAANGMVMDAATPPAATPPAGFLLHITSLAAGVFVAAGGVAASMTIPLAAIPQHIVSVGPQKSVPPTLHPVPTALAVGASCALTTAIMARAMNFI